MEKMQYEEPEMEVVRFNALESVIATSCNPVCGGIEATGIDPNPGGEEDFC